MIPVVRKSFRFESLPVIGQMDRLRPVLMTALVASLGFCP